MDIQTSIVIIGDIIMLSLLFILAICTMISMLPYVIEEWNKSQMLLHTHKEYKHRYNNSDNENANGKSCEE